MALPSTPSMTSDDPRNDLDQPVGFAVDWRGAAAPRHETIEGVRCRLEPLSTAAHAESLHAAFAEDRDGANWTYLPYGPFASAEDYAALVRDFEALGERGLWFKRSFHDVALKVPMIFSIPSPKARPLSRC